MRKEEAINRFGSVASLATALGITRQAIYQWEEVLPQDQADRINGAAFRLGINTVPPAPTLEQKEAA
jgi:transcriptional regulator with XRE-family HTH domain